MIVIGIIGIVFPTVISLTLNFFVSSLFFLSALALTYSAFVCRTQTLMMWIKPFILLVLALLILFHPAVVVSTLGIILALYFLFDGFAGIALSVEMKPAKGWFFMLLNGLLSLLLGAIVLAGWPLSSAWLVGLLIGISFLFDGIALLAIAGNIRATE
ncbi:DUF308 domain-containing protein [Methyloprofundus sp.]|uniref:DUF308 domain-containing protein n=1 Tax=Methyloprofundus sp. TaxID=2020875 RepID=UPI003D124250